MKVLAGDWKAESPIAIKKSLLGKPVALLMPKGVFSFETVALRDVATLEIVTEDNQASIAGKLGWGAAGLVVLGPLGLLAGVLGGGNKRDRVMALSTRDGRKALIKGQAKEAEMLIAAAYQNQA
jgi:hypothetical protein